MPAGVGSVSFQVPARLVLLGGRTRAEIRFDASPLLFGVSAAGLASQASIDAMYAEIAAAEARRRIDDDNEDD